MNLDFLAAGAADAPSDHWQVRAKLALALAAHIPDPEDFVRAELAGLTLKDRDFQKEVGNAKGAKDPITILRRFFLHRYFVENDGNGVAQGRARSRRCDGAVAHRRAGLRESLPDIAHLPLFSAIVRLKFSLNTPLLTRDDAPFYLFDNAARKDHAFGMPYLAAGSVKGLVADAYRRAFPRDGALCGGNAMERTGAFRRGDASALRLFGVASDGSDETSADDASTVSSAAGRLHFNAIWFEDIQYVLLNPKDKKTGMGTVPIQFEAIAPMTPEGKPVHGELAFFYADPAADADADEAAVRRDLARCVMACAVWLPALGLGAKRRAGYGAVAAEEAGCEVRGWTSLWKGDASFRGPDSWRELALRIAEGAR